MKTGSTRRALMISVFSLLLCVSMFVSTTFAWFTDTASTAVNKIQSGTLDVALEMKDNDGNWVSAEGKTLSFKVNGQIPAEGTEILWEPGCTYELPELRVVNNGNLALKYKLFITGINGDARLNEVIEWTVTLNGEAYTMDAEHSLAAKTGDSVSADVLAISGHMLETAGNDYQNLTIDGIGVTVLATQDTAESDSNGNDYDGAAEYPVFATTVVSTDGNGLVADETKLASSVLHEVTGLPIASATVPAGAKMEEGSTTLELTITKTGNPENFTVETTQYAPKTLEISMNGLAGDNDELVKVEFYIETGLSLVEFYHNGVKMSRCSALKWVDADQEFYYDSTTGLVTMLTKTFSPFTYTSDKLQWDDMRAAAYATPVDTANKVITVATAEELALFKYQVTDEKVNYSGYTLNITADIDLGNGYWRPINPINNMTINGNGHTISNLLVRSCTNPKNGGYGYGFIGNATGTTTIRELTFDRADVAMGKGYVYVGNVASVVLAYTYGTTLFDKVTVINSSLNGYGKVGMLLGMGADPGVKVTFRDCVSMDNTIRAVYNIGGLAGNIQRGNGVDNATVENCTVKNINVIYDEIESYADLSEVSATFKTTDTPEGKDVTRVVSGRYWICDGYYWGGYADYYISYGESSYDATTGDNYLPLANSEYPVNP